MIFGTYGTLDKFRDVQLTFNNNTIVQKNGQVQMLRCKIKYQYCS